MDAVLCMFNGQTHFVFHIVEFRCIVNYGRDDTPIREQVTGFGVLVYHLYEWFAE